MVQFMNCATFMKCQYKALVQEDLQCEIITTI